MIIKFQNFKVLAMTSLSLIIAIRYTNLQEKLLSISVIANSVSEPMA